jgi:hypothetical protein
VANGASAPVATAWNCLGPTCCHVEESAGVITKLGNDEDFTFALNVRRTNGIEPMIELATVLETRKVLEAPEGLDPPAVVAGIDITVMRLSASTTVFRQR